MKGSQVYNSQNITVTAGRTFNHPHESYSNLRPSVSMTATLDEGEDAIAAARQLQAKAEQLVEDHKQSLLKSLEDLFDLTERQKEMVSLRSQLESAQRRLDQIREQHPQIVQANLVSEPGSTVCPACKSLDVFVDEQENICTCRNCGRLFPIPEAAI